ncbi:hypothetical protein Hanom_Chr11g01027051 [Helianthus anomalus]
MVKMKKIRYDRIDLYGLFDWPMKIHEKLVDSRIVSVPPLMDLVIRGLKVGDGWMQV